MASLDTQHIVHSISPSHTQPSSPCDISMRGSQRTNAISSETDTNQRNSPVHNQPPKSNQSSTKSIIRDPSGAACGPANPVANPDISKRNYGAAQSGPRAEEEQDVHPGLYSPAGRGLEQERQKLAESKAKLEQEVKEHTELLRLLRCRREMVAQQGDRLRRSLSPEKQPKSRFTTPDPETPSPPRPPSPSSARKACNESYSRTPPFNESGHPQRERRLWEEYSKFPQTQPPSPEAKCDKSEDNHTTKDQTRRGRINEAQAENALSKDELRDRAAEPWEKYEASWTLLWSSAPSLVRLADIPWPIRPVFLGTPRSTAGETNLEQILTREAISAFLFAGYHSVGKTRRQRLREALLRYHPDRFEARWLGKVPEANGEREQVREAVCILTRILARLLEKEK